jgi:2',3'-cyclic-nucleotide 2'-phosphodiesterase (5'-nucleotidase family)
MHLLKTLTVMTAFAACSAWAAAAEPVSITLLHTNDVHSHFRSDKSPLQLGGVARLRTAIQKVRSKFPDSLLVDGGDWSEGQIYYVEGAGTESLKIMDQLGYDVAVVGNHDWLNGPGNLIDSILNVNPHMTVVGANFTMNGFKRSTDFFKAVHSYALKEVHGVKIAFIGLANYDPIYGGYLSPVKTVDPAPVAAQLSTQLKQQGIADMVVAVSHNAIAVNSKVLEAAPDLDLVIGAHDHIKLLHPVVVPRPGRPDGWVVEAGKWGQYLGQVQLRVIPASAGVPASVTLESYKLSQIDRSVPEDPAMSSRIDALEARIEAKMGPVFHDEVADCETELHGMGIESPIGDFVTDAYRRRMGADVAIDQSRFIYGELHRGPLSSADIFNAIPAIYNIGSGKAWTLHKWTMRGATVSILFRLLYTWKKISSMGGLNFSGLEVIYDPTAQKDSLGFGDIFPGISNPNGPEAVHSLTINGKPIETLENYQFVAGTGIVEAIKIINEKYFEPIPMRDLEDTGIEDWQIVRDYAHSMSPITSGSVIYGDRVRTWQSDLGITPDSFAWFPKRMLRDGTMVARVQLTVRNFGATPSPDDGAVVGLATNGYGYDESVDPIWQGRGRKVHLPALAPGEARTLIWDDVNIPSDRGLYPLTAFIHSNTESNSDNNGTTHYFVP